jgi:opacity protein-like surface antigen
MKKLFSILILSAFPVLTFANTKLETEIKKTTMTSKLSRIWGIGVVYEKQTENSDDQSSELTGVNVQLSRTFKISDDYSTQSIVSTNQISGSTSQSEYDVDSDYEGIVLSQTFSYTINAIKYPIKPYIGLGLGFGRYQSDNKITDSEVRSDFGLNSIEIDASYQMRSTIFGVEVLLDNNLSPFISYTISKISYSEVSSKANKNMEDYDVVNIDAELDELSSSRLTLGLNYTF